MILYWVFLVCLILGVFKGLNQLKYHRSYRPTTTNLLDYIFDTRY